MRLTAYEIASIQDCAARHFGPGAVVRLFGSRTRGDLRGGDIDLHITSDHDVGSDVAPEWDFKADLERLIGERHVDVLVNGPAGPVRTIEKIAVLTGVVLPERSSLGDVSPPPDLRRRDRRHEERDDMVEPLSLTHDLIREAIRAGTKAKGHIREALSNLAAHLPIDAGRLAGFDRAHRPEAESLLLNFGNLVAVIQDQLIRSILIASDEKVAGRSKLDHRHTAEKLGALPDGLAFEKMIEARNQLAPQYPADPAKQANVVNDVVSAAATAIAAFDGLAAYAERLIKDDAAS